MKFLNLSIGSLSVRLTTFTAYERPLADTGQTEYSIVGTPLDSGPAYEPKHIWTIAAMTTFDQWYALNAIFARSDQLRRQQQNYRVTVDDTIQSFIEYGSRTRAVVPGESETIFTGGVAYPARFYARMLEPKSTKQGSGYYPYLTSFTLSELDKFAA
jgi:hypothetical protein